MTVSRRLGATLLTLALAGAGLVWWAQGADVRRVDAACDSWLAQRSSLRTAVDEAEEAAGRAEAVDASEVVAYFNDVDRELAALERWESDGPGVRAGFDDGDPGQLERGAANAFEAAEDGVTDLRELIEQGTPREISGWLPEVEARLQWVDDVCLSAARSRTF